MMAFFQSNIVMFKMVINVILVVSRSCLIGLNFLSKILEFSKQYEMKR